MVEPRWLTDREQYAWRRLAAVLLKLPTELERQLQRDADMTHYEYWVVAILSEAPGRTLQLRDLAARSNASLSRLSHVVSRLEKRGWLRREPCPDDARASNAVLTDAGWRKVVEAAPGHAEAVLQLVFDRMADEDVDHLARVCQSILDQIECDPMTLPAD